jgi:hypothetical protein
MQNLNDDKSTIPKYLEELVKPTPLSVEKLIAAWDGLSFETQLTVLSEYVSTYPQHYRNKICLKSISSKNEYVRLVSKNIGIFPNYKDSSLLVSSNYYLPKWCIPLPDNPIYSPEKFLNLNQIERLIIVSTIDGFGEEIAGIVKYYYTHRENLKNTSEENIFDVLCEYFKGKGFYTYKSGEMSFDGYDEFLKGEAIAAFWELIPIVSESIAYLLIENLPAKSGFKSFTDDIIPNLPEKYLIWFLSNKNNYVSEFRKLIFESDTYSDKIKEAAISCNFSLMDHEFLEIVKYETAKRFGIIEKLVFAGDLSVCIKKAIVDLLKLEKGVDFMLVRCCEQGVKRKLKELSPENQLYNLNIIRLYEIAKRILPWNQKDAREVNFESEVDFLQIDTKGLNTWEIFIKIRDRYERVYKNEEITLHLSEMVDLDEEADFPKANHETFLLKRILKSQYEIIIKTTQSKQPNHLNDFKREILSTINKENENQNSILNKFNDSIKNIENLISAICFNTTLIGFKFWLFFVFVTGSFFAGFGLHWFMTK